VRPWLKDEMWLGNAAFMALVLRYDSTWLCPADRFYEVGLP